MTLPSLSIRGAALAALLAVGASPLRAQSPQIAVGDRVTGELSASDPLLEDDTHYDAWRLRGQRGQRVEIVMESADVDAYLILKESRDTESESVETDDDGGGGTDARIVVTLERDEYWIFANALHAGETGGYTLRVSPATRPAVRGTATIPLLRADRARGTLEEGDPVLDDDSYYDDYRFEARAGERVVFDLESADFDALLVLGWISGDELVEIETDDDSGGGTDARIGYSFTESGSYVLRVNSLSGGEAGDYTLRVTRGGAGSAPGRERKAPRATAYSLRDSAGPR